MHHENTHPLRRRLRLLLAAAGALAAFGSARAKLVDATVKPMEFSEETKTHQLLVQVALGREKADLIIHDVNLLDVHTLTWLPHQDIVVRAKRIAWVGPAGGWKGQADETYDAHGLHAVPGFGEAHKHIESSLLSPEWEAEMVLPLGNTWTVEGSHEFSNVDSEHNVELWLTPRKYGSPLKIFPVLGSATPPTAYERGGGFYGYQEIFDNITQHRWVTGLGEVMDWPSVTDPHNPGYQRIWQDMQAATDARGVIEGHGAGLKDISGISAFAAAGITSDHETRDPQEAWDKLQHGIFLELRNQNIAESVKLFLKNGIKDWSNISFVTDDRDPDLTVQMGGTLNHDVLTAIQAGAPVEAAYAIASYYPARHHQIDGWVGSLAPGRFADVLLVGDPAKVDIKKVFADGQLVAEDGKYLLTVPKIAWPTWATETINIGRPVTAADFVIKAPPGKTEVTAAIQEPFAISPEQKTATLPVIGGTVQRDPAHGIIKAATVDRYGGMNKMGVIFWTGLGPLDPDCAVAASQSHDLHNISVVGSSDEAMAVAVNKIKELEGALVLVRDNKVAAYVRLEIGGLMASRPPAQVAKELEDMYAIADQMKWIGAPGFPQRIRYCMITCSPFRWRIVVPYPGNPGGLVDIATGRTMPIVQ
jgi:adenine deaminase